MSTLTKVLERNIKVIEKNANLTEGRFRLGHHLMPPVGWLNDPNGLCWYKGRYHVFFQYAPFDVEGGLKFWGHYTSEDLVDWKYEGTALYPDSPYDCHGVYSGSAFIENGTIHYFYTGNLKYFDRDDYDYINSGRGSNTVTFTSKDGYNFTKKELLMTTNDYPDDMSNHVRDPKIFKKNDKYYMVLGARDKEGIGMILLYESADLKNWTYKNRITTPQKFGYMWECPDLFEIDGKLYIICCPQGVETQGIDYENVHQVTAMKLNYDFETPVGIVANQPNVNAGILDVDSSEKVARFVRLCDAFNLPVVTLVDTPGYKPGAEQEHAGIIRRGAKVIYAYANAQVPLVTIILRKAFGGAYIVMGSKSIGADMNFAWPSSQIAVLGAAGAVNIIHRKDLQKAKDNGKDVEALRAKYIADYERTTVNANLSLEMGEIDAMIDPEQTRETIIESLRLLASKKRVRRTSKHHGNQPL